MSWRPHSVVMHQFTRIAFTPAVKAAQEEMGSRAAYARHERDDDTPDALGERERAFLARRDSFYLASVSEAGWPYIQHRGGPPGFVHVLDAHTLALADLRGNRQYVSVGNLAGDDRVAAIFVDYPNRARLKLLAHAHAVTRADDPALFERIAAPATAERVLVLRVEGLDWNCPQHITPRFTEAEIRELVAPLVTELAQLRQDNADLRAQLAGR